MSEPKFSKGPWEIGVCEQASPYNTVQVPTIFTYGYTICTLNQKDKRDQNGNWRGFDEDLTEVNANAALIKASPKLYKKLHDILEQQCGECCSTVDVGDIRGKTPCEKGETCPYGMEDIKTLLAEARGEE